MSFGAAIAEAAAAQLAVVFAILAAICIATGLFVGWLTFAPSEPTMISPACRCEDREFKITCGCDTPCMCGVVCK